MKVLALPIEMISYTKSNVEIRPVWFKMQRGDEPMQVIKLDKVITRETEKLAGNIMMIFKFQSLIDNVINLFEIKYKLSICK